MTNKPENPVTHLLATQPTTTAHLAKTILGPVLDLTEQWQVNRLLDTLAAWVDAGGDTAAAATAIGIHRNTVLNRLRQIEKLTGLKLADPAETAQLMVGFWALQAISRPTRTRRTRRAGRQEGSAP